MGRPLDDSDPEDEGCKYWSRCLGNNLVISECPYSACFDDLSSELQVLFDKDYKKDGAKRWMRPADDILIPDAMI